MVYVWVNATPKTAYKVENEFYLGVFKLNESRLVIFTSYFLSFADNLPNGSFYVVLLKCRAFADDGDGSWIDWSSKSMTTAFLDSSFILWIS